MEERIIGNEEIYRKAFLTSPDSVNINRMSDGLYVSVNEGFTNITGYSAEETIGKTSIELSIWVDTGDRDKLVHGLKKEGKVSNLETRFKMKDGTIRFGLMSAAVIELNGVPHILSLTRDITGKKQVENALKESETRYRELIELAPDGILLGSPHGIITGANTRMLIITGRTLEEIIGINISLLFSKDELISVPLRYDLLKMGISVSQERTITRPDGTIVPIEMHTRMMPDGSYQSIFHDITDRQQAIEHLKDKSLALRKELKERREAEKALKRSNKQLGITKLATLNLLKDLKLEIDQRLKVEEEITKLNTELEQRVKERTSQLEAANNELQAFAYSVSHDLRAPLRAIDGFTRFVLEDYKSKLDPEGMKLLGLIRSNTQKMDQLIVDILALSRITRSEHKVSNVDMTKMAISMLNEVASSEMQSKMKIVIEPLPEVLADPRYMKQVWINLISNAIKFSSGEKTPEIKISGYTEKLFSVYSIKDNGAGFNPDYTHKLFGVFQRLHNTNEFEGTGVGLAIVQRIIHRHGGSVWAEGKEGAGATFFFSLPVNNQVDNTN